MTEYLCRAIRIIQIAVFGVWLAGSMASVQAQELSPCGKRRTVLLSPWVDTALWCMEQVIDDQGGGELAFTALAAAPDGTLYAARPLAGQVLALTDGDGDGLPESKRVAAENLTLPNALAYSGGALYIAGGSHIYRLVGEELEIVVDDVPSGGGFWTGGIAVGPDGRIYVGTGAPCDFCEPEDELRGAILSYAPDGSDRQLVASGLRQPAALVFHRGALWTVDTARDGLTGQPNMDELNRVTPGANFGWPYCTGQDNRPDLIAKFDCADAAPPAFSFGTHSTPLALASYMSDTFPSLTGSLLVVLAGRHDALELLGHQVVAVRFDSAADPVSYEVITPIAGAQTQLAGMFPQTINYGGGGFWPHYPLGVAVSPEGWVYISVGGGRVLALRPS